MKLCPFLLYRILDIDNNKPLPHISKENYVDISIWSSKVEFKAFVSLYYIKYIISG